MTSTKAVHTTYESNRSHPRPFEREAANTDSSGRKSNTTPSEAKKALSVTFAPRAKVRWALHINEFSDFEFESCWYSDVEFRAMKRSVRKFAKLAVESGKWDEDEFSMRGLEVYTMEGARRRMQNKVMGRDVVLDEQDLQKEHGRWDPDSISEAYQKVSKPCQALAQEMAQKDQADAQLTVP